MMTDDQAERRNVKFTQWELAVIETALRQYADNQKFVSTIARKQIIDLANRIGEM